jgi:putative DNA primase/helicase
MAQTAGEPGDIRFVFEGAPEYLGDGGGGKRDQRLATKLLNDIGNAERFRARYGRNFLYVKERGWAVWADSHWSFRLGEASLKLAAETTARRIFDEAEAIANDDDKRAKELRRFAIETGRSTRLSAMTEVAQPHLTRPIEALDGDRWLLNCANGTLELPQQSDRPIRLRRHSRRDLITRVLPVAYNPESAAPRWRAHVEWALPEDDKRAFLQRLGGYCLVGDISEQAFVFLWGSGANGKSVITGAWRWLLGEYAQTLPFASLTEDARRRGSDASPEMADLAGVRAIFSAESNPGNRLDLGRINAFTGGERIKVRHLNREFFELDPQGKIIVAFNNKPVIRDPSEGIWRRMMLLAFTQTLPRKEWDLQLGAKLHAEGQGILNWLVDGFLWWRERGLDPPPAVIAATREYRDESDPIGNFLDNATIRIESGSVAARELFACYEGWCNIAGVKPVSPQLFGRLLIGRGLERVKANTIFYRGIQIAPDLDFDWEVPRVV